MTQDSSWQDSPLLALARRGHLRWAAAVAPDRRGALDRAYPLVALAVVILVPVTGAVLASALVPLATALVASRWPDAAAAAGLAVAYLPVFGLLAGWLWLVEDRPLWTIGLRRAGAARRYLVGGLIGLALLGAAVGLLALAGLMVPAGPPVRPAVAWSATAGVVMWALAWAVQGAAEEALFRGFLLPVVGLRWGVAAGVGLSALTFAGLHGLNSHIGPLALANLLLFGCFAALYALREGGLWGICALHAAWNWAQANLLGLQVSGAAARWATVVDLNEVGPDLLTGGPFGPEGGLAVTVVLVVAISVLAWRTHNAGGPRSLGRPRHEGGCLFAGEVR